ncbi:acyltransferase family protein [Rhodococcus sp. BP-349]|uniref:lysophospholipid acyltransferase family protein n=1 Tax=unclassified Rhodococcus (in: high G+C Gram-positive bacteria) TaxID=192944 RepID=UPI001C9BAA89|nr:MULTISPECIES: lysophospholipid acyltransferase family protein [unclassified Rhodococcus (in: high G+C Gram-positive bacteria)]MBY6539782.1 acyltransferase family protein [Rhodococcus sp. BP-363]MBY6543890.1 acyltransferase family protein [Rhodococcus sp. BP-369]MBY6563120.1 acyltransferase family protein [Rhodococcus sp. BP-370]MBY6577412.1 acyltransferase family protein [Rhodococcus sp. BP-364]MBY6586713.1 acyltransferase family protein [Rhodococcus sp. BP-358]
MSGADHTDVSPADHRDPELQDQAERVAAAARLKMKDKRENASGGLSGLVASRAGDWDLTDQDVDSMRRQEKFWNPLVDKYFRMEIDGWETIPPPPVLLVGVHSGAPFVWDAWTVGAQWWRRFGPSRTLHGTAHDALMAFPLIGTVFRSMGVLPAAPDSMSTALAEGRDVIVWPGGEVDSLRPWSERDVATLGGRTGFIKLAIRCGVPIVPIATVGGADAMPVLVRGDKLSKMLGLDKIARLKVFPIAVSLPWIIAPAALPQIPLPAKIRTRFMPPVEVDHDLARVDDEEYVEAKYEEVRRSIQSGMDALATKRKFPLFR